MLYAPLVTPFKSDESVDFEALQFNVSKYDKTSLTGYLVNGSSGEAEMLTAKERDEALLEVCRATEKPVLAGLIATSTYDALTQLEGLAESGVEACLIRTPSYFGKQLDQVSFFTELADQSPVPVMIYQIPQYTGIRLTGDELFPLSQHPNILGIKDSLGDLALLNECPWPDHFRYFLGASALLQPGLAAGACGGILALANVVPEMCATLLELCEDSSRHSEARELQRRLIPLNRMLGGSRGLGLAGLKAACKLQGFKTGPVRRPLRDLKPEQLEILEAELLNLKTNA